ncbi:MAG: leucine--tRNA ligase [Deltaproteobacteria bacterium]|nr:MAG: leucine--tRNA ligase [Deltaproteobacteria bacterium]
MTQADVYDPAEVESRWQRRWDEDRHYDADVREDRPKHYALTMLPYPSGDLHIGHWYAMVPSDARARFMRLRGYNVMFPMGFDAFGLPAENAAIKRNLHPRDWTRANIERMRGQLRRMGAMFDWRREVITCEPAFYRWSQWIFLRFLERGLAYRKAAPVDFCPSCNTTLAREQVQGEDRHCERCDTPVEKRHLEQWFFRTTEYAEELLEYPSLDWPERVKTLQRNWIGRSTGAQVVFRTEAGDAIEVFTTRPDTLWGATFMVLAPEHPLVERLTTPDRRSEVEAYVAQAARQSDVVRETAEREKTGVFTGGHVVNPVNGERIPVWIADYVLMTYGTGAIMAVPAHDQRDFEFARRYGIEIRVVIQDEGGERPSASALEAALPHAGTMVNSGPLSGTPADQAVGRTVEYLEARNLGRAAVGYRLRDWLISRQRYWGTPIPVVHCGACGVVPVPDAELPVLLPDDVEWRPTGESPLKLHPTWKHTACPGCGGDAERESDTMDTFMCSSLYHLRYLNPRAEVPVDPREYDYWMPVDTYTGGIEHATMHLIYTRFFHKACRDIGITRGPEPMIQLRNQGIILGEDSEKMSKSRGNVDAPDALVDSYGADTVRAYLMFFARWDQGGPWSSQGVEGTARWLRRVFALLTDPGRIAGDGGTPGEGAERELRRATHQVLERVTRDFESFEFNTVISALMELLNEMYRLAPSCDTGGAAWQECVDIYLRMLAPVAPHLAEELWSRLEKPYSVHVQAWPEVDAAAAAEDEITLVVQVNGKLRDRIRVPAGIDREAARERALASEAVGRFVSGKAVRKVIFVPGRLVNIVV